MNIRHTFAASIVALSLLGCHAAPVTEDTTDSAAVTIDEVDEDEVALTDAYASYCAAFLACDEAPAMTEDECVAEQQAFFEVKLASCAPDAEAALTDALSCVADAITCEEVDESTCAAEIDAYEAACPEL